MQMKNLFLFTSRIIISIFIEIYVLRHHLKAGRGMLLHHKKDFLVKRMKADMMKTFS